VPQRGFDGLVDLGNGRAVVQDIRMDLWPSLQSLALLTIANGAPVIAKKIFGSRLAFPLDAGVHFVDGRPLLGPSKTIRGVVLSVALTAAAAPVLGISVATGALVACLAMLGDIISSFTKRRLKLPSSAQAIGLDQIPESLLPLLVCKNALSLTSVDIIICVGIFLGGELLISRALYMLHIRDQPY
jgi:CDP-archaeol synthase